MQNPHVTIVDYRMGNLHSIANALRAVGATVTLANSPAQLEEAGHVVLPGVGAFGASMANLAQAGLDTALREHARRGRPLLGICLGFQVLFERGTEHGQHSGLGLFAGTVDRFVTRLHVPHVGWNEIVGSQHHPLLARIPDHTHMFFVHSFRPVDTNPRDVLATSDYDGEFCCAVARDNVAGTQFHPEKSGEAGLRLLADFVRWSP